MEGPRIGAHGPKEPLEHRLVYEALHRS